MKNLPSWAKGIVAVSMILIISFIAYKIYKKIQENKSLEGAGEELKQANKRLNSIPPPTLSTPQITGFANQLEAAMQGYGSSFGAIKTVFNAMGNEADVLSLIKAYGIRELSSGSWNPSGNFKGNLNGALTDELSTSEIEYLNQILSGKSINYKF